MDPTEPTLAAMSAAAEQARAANHAAYDAPGDPPALYARVGALYDLLVKTRQLTQVLGTAATKAAAHPERMYADDGSNPSNRAARAAMFLLESAQSIDTVITVVNEAWSELSHLGVKP